MRRACVLALALLLVAGAAAADGEKHRGKRDGEERDDGEDHEDGREEGVVDDLLDAVQVALPAEDAAPTPSRADAPDGVAYAPADASSDAHDEDPSAGLPEWPAAEGAARLPSPLPQGEAGAVGALAALAVGGAVLLGGAAWLARRSRRPKARKPSRRTFEHGRRLGGLALASTEAHARAAIEAARIGKLAALAVDARGVDVELARGRSQPCAQAAGFLTGLYERVWAHEVVVEHAGCAGAAGACRYRVRRV